MRAAPRVRGRSRCRGADWNLKSPRRRGARGAHDLDRGRGQALRSSACTRLEHQLGSDHGGDRARSQLLRASAPVDLRDGPWIFGMAPWTFGMAPLDASGARAFADLRDDVRRQGAVRDRTPTVTISWKASRPMAIGSGVAADRPTPMTSALPVQYDPSSNA